MAWELCSKEDVIRLHPISEEALLDQWSEHVEALIRQHVGSPYLGNPTAIVGEIHSGDDTSILRVRKPPIVSVEKLRIHGWALQPSDYVTFKTYIQLRGQVFPKGDLNIELDYTSGEEIVDPVIKLCAAAMIIAIINYYRTRGADANIKWGDIKREGEPTPNVNVGLTSHLYTIMRRLLKRHKVRVR